MVLEKQLLNGLEKTLELPESLDAPVERGQEVGALVVRHGGKELCRIPVLAGEAVERLGLWDLFQMVLRRICGR